MASLRALLLTAALTFALPARALAQDARMQSFVQQVLERNPTLRARMLVRESARARAGAEGYWPDPEFSVMLDRVPERHEGEMPMVRYQVSQMIMWPGKLRLMAAVSSRQAETAATEVHIQANELARQAKQAYLMLARNRGYRDVNGATQRLLETVTRAAIARYGAGIGGHHEVTRAEVERSALGVEAISLEGERASIVAMLNALRNYPVDAPMEDPVLPALGSGSSPHRLSELLRVALANRAELKQMRSMAREEATMAEFARRERYPDLMTGVWYNQMLGGPDTAGVMVGARIPLFSASQQNRRAEAAELAARGKQSELAGMQAMVRYQVADALQRAQTAARAVEFVTTVARPRAEQSFASALSAYATAGADMAFVLDAWRALQRLEQARIDAVLAERMALVDLEWAVGATLAKGSR